MGCYGRSDFAADRQPQSDPRICMPVCRNALRRRVISSDTHSRCNINHTLSASAMRCNPYACNVLSLHTLRIQLRIPVPKCLRMSSCHLLISCLPLSVARPTLVHTRPAQRTFHASSLNFSPTNEAHVKLLMLHAIAALRQSYRLPRYRLHAGNESKFLILLARLPVSASDIHIIARVSAILGLAVRPHVKCVRAYT
jgi:hypothetical protein